jgi:aromatic-L-amino-acid decarboxylase
MPKIKPLTLDPEDWEDTRRTFHQAIDTALDWTRDVRERAVWQPVPENIKTELQESVPHHEQPLPDVVADFERQILPYSTGNTHPRFWGWVHGSGNVAGALGEMLAGFLNCNVGGRDHGAVYVERQVIRWCQEIFGFPHSASGLLTTGTSMGTLIALNVARDAKAGADVRKFGLAGLPKRLVGYASSEAHACVSKTFEMLGLGSDSLRLVSVNSDYQLNVSELSRMVAADRASGLEPFVVIASAGTVNTGAIDDLKQIADFCLEQNLWMHVDAAFGGLAILTPEFQERLAPIGRADSVAFDFHKWLHVPYDAGCVLIQDEMQHRQTFSARREYLASQSHGVAGGNPWYCEYGPELSRGFRALKVWFTLKTYGLDHLAALIAQNCHQAQALGTHVQNESQLELLADIALNIVCFRFCAPDVSDAELNALNAKIVEELQIQGIAAPSTTRLGGKTAIRVALTNHRTTDADLQLLAAEVLRLGMSKSVISRG